MTWKTDLAAHIAATYTGGESAADILADLTAPGLELATRDVLNYLSVAPTPAEGPGQGASVSLALRVLGRTGTAEQQAMVEEIFAQLERNETISLSVPAYLAALSGQIDLLIGAGLLTEADKTALLALARPRGESKAQALGLPAGLALAHVEEAMGG